MLQRRMMRLTAHPLLLLLLLLMCHRGWSVESRLLLTDGRC